MPTFLLRSDDRVTQLPSSFFKKSKPQEREAQLRQFEKETQRIGKGFTKS